MTLFILGLTGSIGMGKSAVVRMFARYGVPAHDADAVSRAVTEVGGAAVPGLKKLVPTCFSGEVLNRAALGALIFADPGLRRRVEGVIHPLVQQSEEAFLRQARMDGHRLVVLDIPLLFETGADKRVDAVAVVSAAAGIQRARVLRRPGMTMEKLNAILDSQLPDQDKRARADFIIPTGGRLRDTLHTVKTLIWALKYARNRS
ncbi:MAG: dephospho-CoA kinase [Pseudomonadota bacterium]